MASSSSRVKKPQGKRKARELRSKDTLRDDQLLNLASLTIDPSSSSKMATSVPDVSAPTGAAYPPRSSQWEGLRAVRYSKVFGKNYQEDAVLVSEGGRFTLVYTDTCIHTGYVDNDSKSATIKRWEEDPNSPGTMRMCHLKFANAEERTMQAVMKKARKEMTSTGKNFEKQKIHSLDTLFDQLRAEWRPDIVTKIESVLNPGRMPSRPEATAYTTGPTGDMIQHHQQSLGLAQGVEAYDVSEAFLASMLSKQSETHNSNGMGMYSENQISAEVNAMGQWDQSSFDFDALPDFELMPEELDLDSV